MKRIALLVSVLAVLTGCSGGDDKYTDQAPPPSANAVAGTPKTDKKMPGANQMADGGAGAGGVQQATPKPDGM